MKRLIIVLILLSCLGFGCNNTGKEIPKPKYEDGGFVISALSKQTGQILWSSAVWDRDKKEWFYKYRVRFMVESSSTDTHLLSNDGDIRQKPFSIVIMRGFELRGFNE